MTQVESRLSLEEPESSRKPDLREEMLALLEIMQKEALIENQVSLLQHLKVKLMALDISDVKVLANEN